MCFTLVYTFNLVQLATGTTDRASCKACGYSNAYDWSLVVLLFWLCGVLNFHFWLFYWCYSAVVMTGCVGRNCWFMSSISVFSVCVSICGLAVGAVSVSRL